VLRNMTEQLAMAIVKNLFLFKIVSESNPRHIELKNAPT